jgi:DNA-damage-inducible protein J
MALREKTQMIHTRIDPHLKHSAELVFNTLGINLTDAIRMFLTQVTLTQGIPFDVKIPNKKTRKAMEDSRKDRNLTRMSQEEFHEFLNAK